MTTTNTQDQDKCIKEGAIAEAQITAEQALQQSAHIYSQLEELRNTLQRLCFTMMNCKDDHRRELAYVSQQLHAAQMTDLLHAAKQSSGGTSIQVSPVIDVGDKSRVPESETPAGFGRKLTFPLAMVLGSGFTVGLLMVVFYFIGKALKWF